MKNIIDVINIERDKFPLDKLQLAQLGDVESAFALIQKEYSANELNQKLQPYKVEGTANNLEAIQLKERLNLLESQKILN